MSRPVYCDESIWVPVANGLARRGWEVHHARDEDRLGESDRAQLAFAEAQDWWLLTFDDDFLALVDREQLSHAGLLYVEQTGKRIGEVVKAVDALLDDADHSERAIHYL